MANPLSSQCTAMSKREGRRCRHMVVGGGVCHIHGGAAKQVKAKREQRVLVAEAQAEARAAAPEMVVMREPEEILLHALHDTNAVLQQIKRDIQGSVVNPLLLQVAGDWFDRVARIGKTVTDGDLATKLHQRLGWLAEDRGQQMWGLLVATVKAAPLSAKDRLVVWNSVEAGLRAVLDEREPLRLSGDEVHRVTDRLMAEAAREEALAAGLSWGPDAESESDSDAPLFDGAAL